MCFVLERNREAKEGTDKVEDSYGKSMAKRTNRGKVVSEKKLHKVKNKTYYKQKCSIFFLKLFC